MKTPSWKKWLILIVGLMENLIFTGSILGWSALNYMLKEEGVFENLCDLPVNSDIHIPMIPSILQNYSTIEYLPFETHNLMPPSTQSSLITSSNVSSVFYTNQDLTDNSTRLSSIISSLSSTPTPSTLTITSKTCATQDRVLNLAFTVGTFFNGFTAFVWGFLLDKWGLRRVRLLINAFLTLGSILLCFTSRARSYLIFPSVILLCLGGVPLRIANMQIANLFPKQRSSVITFYSGAFSASAFTFVILKFMFDAGLSFYWTSFTLVLLSLAMLPATFFLLPSTVIKEDDLSGSKLALTFTGNRKYYEKNITGPVTLEKFRSLKSPSTGRKIPNKLSSGLPIPQRTTYEADNLAYVSHGSDDDSLGNLSHISTTSTVTTGATTPTSSVDGSPSLSASTVTPNPSVSPPPVPLKVSLFSLAFLLHQWWFSWLITYMIMYVGSMNLWLNRVTHDAVVAGNFTKIYGLIQILSLAIAPLAGFWMDYQVNQADLVADPLERKLKRINSGFWPMMFTTATLAGILACRFFNTPLAIYISILFITFLRSFLVAVASAFLRIRFPGDHFARLLGIMSTFGAIISLLQFPLFIWEASSPECALWVNLFNCVCTVLAFLNPLHLASRRLQKRLLEKEERQLILAQS
uniref:Major facilitator superfamily (MFS) profile domain-containing protein n=1 Tax=Tetranychus urticae TaxID=32264 RepID=T1K030_TETUR